MPEGDTIHRAARSLRAALGGQRIRDVHSTVPAVSQARLSGHNVSRVEARGKNLLIHFDDGRALYTHMKMTGSWHVYRDRERWAKPPRRAKVILHTDRIMAVCFNAPVIEVLTPLGLKRHPVLSTLGPDLLDPGFNWNHVARRLAQYGTISIGEALLMQRIACGIGNVYKSETLFLCGQDPFAQLDTLDANTVRALYDEARKLMNQNMGHGMRDTRRKEGGRYWVYGRSGEQCRRCATKIGMRRQGAHGRSTYFCPRCQSVSEFATGASTRSRP